MKLELLLASKAQEAVSALYGEEVDVNSIQVQKTKKEFEGDLTIVVFPLLRFSKKGPEQTAEDLGTFMKEHVAEVSDFNVIKGFLNLSITDSYWLSKFNGALQAKTFGHSTEPSGKTVMVEYSSPNTNKPLHLGHLRNNFLGYSVAEILKANGHQVYKTQIINDRGIHICKSMIAWLKEGNGETPESSGLKGDKFVGKYYVAFDKMLKAQIAELEAKGQTKEEAEKAAPIMDEARDMLLKWEAKDPEVYSLWEKMNGWVYDGFDITYKTMGVDFDKLYYESNTFLLGKDVVDKGLAEKVFYKKEDGSVWIDLSDHKLDHKLLLRSDGTSVYMTQDIGTAIQRKKDYPPLTGMIYTVATEQDHHFKVLFLILSKLGFEWAKECYHLSYGMVDLPSGKMKSREGTVVDADDLMADMVEKAAETGEELGKLEGLDEAEKQDIYRMIGLGAIKYYILKVDPKRGMLFNPEESIDFQGNTAPFIGFSYVRTRSIHRRLEGEDISFDVEKVTLVKAERELLKTIYDYPKMIKDAGAAYSPALLANYVYDLVKVYNSFYQEVSILKEQDVNLRNFRVNLSNLTGTVIKSAMELLGIEVPERM
jgi:arginyl-tRNA synthetase